MSPPVDNVQPLQKQNQCSGVFTTAPGDEHHCGQLVAWITRVRRSIVVAKSRIIHIVPLVRFLIVSTPDQYGLAKTCSSASLVYIGSDVDIGNV